MKIKMNNKINNTNDLTMGNAASKAYNEIEEFRDTALKKIEEQKKPIYEKINNLYVEIDHLNAELKRLIDQENEVFEMAFKYEELFNEYAMREIFK